MRTYVLDRTLDTLLKAVFSSRLNSWHWSKSVTPSAGMSTWIFYLLSTCVQERITHEMFKYSFGACINLCNSTGQKTCDICSSINVIFNFMCNSPFLNETKCYQKKQSNKKTFTFAQGTEVLGTFCGRLCHIHYTSTNVKNNNSNITFNKYSTF